MVGRRPGLPLLRRWGRYIGPDEDQLLIGRYLFFQYGNAVVFFGRFIAVLRMFAALLAGANSMPAGRIFLIQYSWWSLLGESLRLRCLCSGRRNVTASASEASVNFLMTRRLI